jgi:tetratricopeptide (TPR) repeat protein
LKEELCYQLNMDYSLDTAQYTALAGTQAEPSFILIDGLNESSNAESIWLEILEISCAFEPGSLKFIITSRANTKTDLDRYVISEDQMQYLYGENKDHETGLGAYAFWLTPLDMKEMESAWESYVAKDKNRFKPLFSFNDIATFDRGLYLQINNPLVLRIFLETYKGKNLPKKETKHLHVWKDWFVTFSNEEQKFMSLLAEAVWELGENELLLDTVLNNKNLQSYFLNDTTNAPYQRLLTLGWISRYVKDLTVYVSFTVEGLLFYLLGTKLNQQNPIITTATIDEILTNGTKLQKSAIEAFLCEQALEGKIELIAQLIDEGEEKLELCVTPLLYFLKSQGVEKTIEKLLENPTENDWKALLELDSRLYNLQLNLIRKDFLTKVMSQNQFQTKEAVWLGLNAIALFDKEKAMFYLSKIDTSANFIQTDNDLLFLLGNCEYTFGNYNKSLEYYEKCLSIELKDLGDEHPAVATSYNGIGMTYHNKGKYDKALEYFEKSMVLRLKKLGSEFQNVAKSYNNIGGAWEGKGEYDKALKYHKKCLEIRLKTLGSEHPDVATSYNNIGMSCHKKGDYNEALEYFEKSVTIFLKTLDCEHPNVATSYNNIGLTWKYKCEYDKALEYYEKCLSILLKTLGEEHPSVATSYNNIGLTWKLKGEFDKALEYYEKCIAIRLKTLGKEHPSFASSYNNIGGIWGSKSEYDKALENYEKCLVILLKTFGGEHPDVATSYNNIGNTWKDKGEYDKALKFYEMSLAIYSKVFGWEHPNIALSYSNIGGILNLKGKYDKALEYFEKCLAIELKTLGSKHSDVATSYFNIANCYYELKNYQCAIDKYKKGFITSRKGGFPFQIAQCYEELNEKENALDYYIQSAGIRKEDPVVGLEADATQEAIANAKRLAVELGKEEDLPKWMN